MRPAIALAYESSCGAADGSPCSVEDHPLARRAVDRAASRRHVRPIRRGIDTPRTVPRTAAHHISDVARIASALSERAKRQRQVPDRLSRRLTRDREPGAKKSSPPERPARRQIRQEAVAVDPRPTVSATSSAHAVAPVDAAGARRSRPPRAPPTVPDVRRPRRVLHRERAAHPEVIVLDPDVEAGTSAAPACTTDERHRRAPTLGASWNGAVHVRV